MSLTAPLRTALRPCRSILPRQRRWNTDAATARPPPSPTPSQQLVTLREIDRLLRTIAKSSRGSAHHPSPLAMRTHFVPWLSSHSPNLESQGHPPAETAHPQLSEEEKQALLKPKHMNESYTSFELPLASDPELLEKYVNTSGGFRMGKLLEHLDSLAGAVAYRHCLPTPSRLLISTPATQTQAFHEASHKAGIYLATASADRLDMFGRLNRANMRDLRFSGFVTWTGNSSMEVVVKMQGSRSPSEGGSEAEGGEKLWDTLMLGRFAMVCRDSTTNKSRRVPPLIVETEEEKKLWEISGEHQRRRRETSKMSLDKVPPSSEEARDLHDLMTQVVDKGLKQIQGEEIVHMRDTEISSVQLMFPQDRNLHGKVFGGILMRLAFELCFTNAAIFASKPMRFLALDQITFRLPVPIGAVLRLTSKIVKTTRPHDGPDGEAKAHIMVRAEVEEVETGSRLETNTFFFTMAMEDHEPIGRTVVPETYSEAMAYLEGKRRLAMGDAMRQMYEGAGDAH